MNTEGLDVAKMGLVAKEKRKAKSLSQKGLAEQFGLSDNYIGLLERGDVGKLNQDNVERILSFLGMSLSEFNKAVKAPPPEIPKEPEEHPDFQRPTPPPDLPRSAPRPDFERPAPRPDFERPAPRPGFERPAPRYAGRPEHQGRGDRGEAVRHDRGPVKAAPNPQLKQHTGKELQRLWEWIRFKVRLKVKLFNGEELEGYLKWSDQFSVKLIAPDAEYVIPKHSILYYAEGPKPKWTP